MTWATWLVALIGPLAARVVASLGFTFVSVAGLTAAVSTLKGMVTSHIGGLPGDALALGGLFGICTCVGMIFGTLTFCVTWQATRGFWMLAKK